VTYADWRRRFYPDGLPVREWLPFYAHAFDTVELNRPFYRLPTAETFATWRRLAPPRLRFRGQGQPLPDAHEEAQGPRRPTRAPPGGRPAAGAEARPGPVPAPRRLPRERRAAGRLSRGAGAAAARPRAPGALEVRHASWLEPAVLRRLTKAGVALCFADWGAAPVTGPVTADFVYVRRHGVRRGSYSEAELRADARAIRAGSARAATSTSTSTTTGEATP
jgi:uncharacterized protein YecE (DUF72 family)